MQARSIGEQVINFLATLGQNETTKKCRKYDVKLSHLEGGEETEMEAFKVPSITSLRNVYPEVIEDNYTHLKEVPFSGVSEKEFKCSHVEWS